MAPDHKKKTKLLATAATALLIVAGTAGAVYYAMNDGIASLPANEEIENINTIAQDPVSDLGIATGDVQIGTAPYSLTDMNGQTITQASFAAQYKLVFFGFTSCTAVCPMVLNNIGLALSELGPDAVKIQPLFITVDPARDTPEVLKKYVANFNSQILGVTGTPEQIEAAKQAFRVYASQMPPPDAEGNHGEQAAHGDHASGYQMAHSDQVFLLNGNNDLLNIFAADADSKTIAGGIQTVLAAELIKGSTDAISPPNEMGAPDVTPAPEIPGTP